MVKGERNPIGPNIHAAACNTPLFVFFFILQKNPSDSSYQRWSHPAPFSMSIQELLTQCCSLKHFHLLCLPSFQSQCPPCVMVLLFSWDARDSWRVCFNRVQRRGVFSHQQVFKCLETVLERLEIPLYHDFTTFINTDSCHYAVKVVWVSDLQLPVLFVALFCHLRVMVDNGPVPSFRSFSVEDEITNSSTFKKISKKGFWLSLKKILIECASPGVILDVW